MRKSPFSARFSTKGQLTLPQAVREQLSLQEGDRIEIMLLDQERFIGYVKHQAKGQITLPKAVRQQLGLKAGDRIEIETYERDHSFIGRVKQRATEKHP